jgi:glycosyltransferase involved in cell wall biosynthesis
MEDWIWWRKLMPKVSFVIPVWDGDTYLAETIESLRRQTLKDIEIIVIDDCSPDFTPELMEWYLKQDERIKYHRFEENKGVCSARNFGNQMAEAELICVSDQDDLSEKHRAFWSWGYMNRHPEVNCLTSAYYECNVAGVKLQKFTPMDMTRELFESEKFVWFHSSACYRKKDILEHPYVQVEGVTDDWKFLDDWTNLGMKFHTTKQVLGNCRRVPWGVMQGRRAAQGASPSFIL